MYMLQDQCPAGHERSWKCHNPPRECTKCEAEKRRKQKELQRLLKAQEKRARDEQEHSEHMAMLDALLADERQRLREAQLSRTRALAVQQKERDLADAQAMTLPAIDPLSNARNGVGSSPGKETSVQSTQAPSTSSNNEGVQSPDSANKPSPKWTQRRRSPAKEEWERQKTTENARNDAIDSLMNMIGLEEVKLQILQIKAKIEVSMRQNADMSSDRLNISFLGNPGTGKIPHFAAFY